MLTVFHAQSTSLDLSHSSTARQLPRGVQEFCHAQNTSVSELEEDLQEFPLKIPTYE